MSQLPEERAELASEPLLRELDAGCWSGLTRPEGILFFGVAGLWSLLAASPRGPITRPRVAVTFAIAFAVTILPHTLWRLATYGDLLPNTFHAKVGVGEGGPERWRRGIG